jgi:hypothetical protein
MSIGQTFPDVIDLGQNRFRLITEDALDWVHQNTTAPGPDIPREIQIDGTSVVDDMRADGLRVRPSSA